MEESYRLCAGCAWQYTRADSHCLSTDLFVSMLQLMGMASRLNSSNRSQFNDMQSFLCATLTSVLRRLSVADATVMGESTFKAIMVMLQVSSVGSVQEDALAAVGALIELLGPGFTPYLAAFKPYLVAGLGAMAEAQVRGFAMSCNAVCILVA